MDMFEISNELGQISFSKAAIFRICEDAVGSCDGNVRIQNYKSRYTAKRPGILTAFSSSDEDYEDIELEETAEGIFITVYVVVRFGTSISTAANRIIDHIYAEMESLFGVRPACVTVIITGVASKTIAKRHIEYARPQYGTE